MNDSASAARGVMAGRTVMREVRTVDELDAWLADPARGPAAVQRLDLRHRLDIERGRWDDCLFLSCDLTPAQAGFLTMSGATVIGDDHSRPYPLHRARLYTAAELYAGFDPDVPGSYAVTLDKRVYDHFVATGKTFPFSLSESLSRRLHDFSIADAFGEALEGARPAAIMGGHAVERADPLYRSVAELSRELVLAGHLMLSGGGPGLMEATHLGAAFAGRDPDELADALAVLAPRPADAEPGREYADADWLRRAFLVIERWGLADDDAVTSIGVPTWAYGHEPPAPFASLIAKFFENSLREDGLLAAASHGVVFMPGSAGTVQEIFQDGAQNHYETFGPPSPMVLFDTNYWTRTHPAWPLLESLATGRAYRDLLLLTDDPAEAIDFICAHHRPSD